MDHFNVRMIYNKETNKPKGYSFIEYAYTRDMKAAYKQVDGRKIDAIRVLVDVESGRTVPNWRPRRLGGGLGTTRVGGEDVIQRHVTRFHLYGHDMTRQVTAHHFCAHQNEEMRQCLIYDSPEPNARLIGIEFVISENLFMTLPDSEKRMWHSHEYEVKSGVLFFPGIIPGDIQRQDLAKVAQTYGKTRKLMERRSIYFWQVDRGDNLPVGIPQIMMALTRDGQLQYNISQDVQKKFNVDFAKERGKRAYMKGLEHGIYPLANAEGKGLRTELREVDCNPGAAAHAPPRVFV